MLWCWYLNTQEYIGGSVEEKVSFSTTGLCCHWGDGWSHIRKGISRRFFYGVIEKAFHNCYRKWDSWAVFNVSEVYKDMIFRCVNISVQSHFLFPTQHFWLAILPCLLRDFIPPLSSCPGEFGNRDVNFFFFNLTFSIQNEWEISAQGALGA